jgi:hypothetical protein
MEQVLYWFNIHVQKLCAFEGRFVLWSNIKRLKNVVVCKHYVPLLLCYGRRELKYGIPIDMLLGKRTFYVPKYKLLV